jgi:hypothetical protein
MLQQSLSTKLGNSFRWWSLFFSRHKCLQTLTLSSSMDAFGKIWYVGMVHRSASTSEIEAELICGQSIESYD